jgi:hypothetical protein
VIVVKMLPSSQVTTAPAMETWEPVCPCAVVKVLPSSQVTTAPAMKTWEPAVLVTVVKVLPSSQITTVPVIKPGACRPCDCGKDASQFSNHNDSPESR